MTQLDKEYDTVLQKILSQGVDDGDRTGTGTRKITGEQVRFDVSAENFPIVTKKRIVWNSLWTELVWFIQGRTNVEFLQDHGVGIWNQWAESDGELGPIYGKQWRDWNGTDQLQQAVDGLRKNPTSRRYVVSAWNVDDLSKMRLVPCHYSFQFVSTPQSQSDGERKLNIVVSQRSSDTFIGACYNWSSYATLLVLISKITNHNPGEVIWNGGDVHLYQNHFEQARKVIELDKTYEAPRLEIEDIDSLDDIQHSTVELKNYEHGPFIKAPIAV